MKNYKINFDEKEAYKLAEEYFIKTCGLDLGKKKYQKILTLGMDARSQGLGGIDIRAVISSYGPEVFEDHKVKADGAELNCLAFHQIDGSSVKKIYAYSLTAGECSYSDDDNIMKQLLADIWGTSYTDAGRYLLERYITEDIEKEYPGRLGKDIFLSVSFGPGFYGMEVVQTKELFRILDTQSIDMEVRESGIMLPLKSCAGLYFVVSDPSGLPHPDCMECIGNTKGCGFCRVRNGHESLKSDEALSEVSDGKDYE